MPRPKVNLVVLDPGSGKARPGSWVTFYHSNTQDKAALFADDDVAPIANPVQANGLGQVAVRVASGTYDVSMTWDGAVPTVVEDVLAWTPEVDVITSPGDLIIGGPGGENVRLAVGANGQVLLVENGLPTWRTLKGGVGLPPGGPGSLLSYGTNSDLSVILPGLQDQALAMQGGVPTWVSTLLPPGTTLPINQPGDLVVGAVTTGLPARMARGEIGSILTTSASGGLEWTPSIQVAGAVGRGRGDCILWSNYPNDTEVHLYRQKGNSIWIDGTSRVIPELGVHLGLSGLTPDVLYYIYAAWVGGAIVLEASTTPNQEVSGLMQKTGDPTRTFVGMAWPTMVESTMRFANNETQRLVISYFNRAANSASRWLTAPRTTGPTTDGIAREVHPEIRVSFLTWWDAALIAVSGTVRLDGTNGVYPQLTMDGQGIANAYIENPGGVVPWEYENFYIPYSRVIAQGYHWVSLFYGQTGASATWQGDGSGVGGCRTHVILAGST